LYIGGQLFAFELSLARLVVSDFRFLLLFVKNRKAIMDKGMSLLSKSIAGNKRLKEYFKAGSAEDEIELSQFEYDLAKKKSSDASEIENLRKSLENAKKEADDIITRFSASAIHYSCSDKIYKDFQG